MTDSPTVVGAIVNPRAGEGGADALAAAFGECCGADELRTEETASPAAVPDAVAALEDVDLLAVAGGDGTVGRVADALARRDGPPLAVVPAGRGNSLFRHLYAGVQPSEWRTVARGVEGGFETVPLDLVHLTGEDLDRYAALGASVGLFRRALGLADRLRALPGPLAYLLATGLAAVRTDARSRELRVDGAVVHDGRALLVAVGGGRYRGRGLSLFPTSEPGDGRLDVLALEPPGVRGGIGLLRRARAGDLGEHPALSRYVGRTVAVDGEDPLALEIDGTPVDSPPRRVSLRVAPGAVSYARPDGTAG